MSRIPTLASYVVAALLLTSCCAGPACGPADSPEVPAAQAVMAPAAPPEAVAASQPMAPASTGTPGRPAGGAPAPGSAEDPRTALPPPALRAPGAQPAPAPRPAPREDPPAAPGAPDAGAAAFEERWHDGRLWVFRAGSKELARFDKDGELAKHVIRPRAGPGGVTLKAPDADTILAYVARRPGFVTEVHDGRLWVFKAGAKELERFRKDGELAKHVVRPGAGPLGATLKAPDAETILAYVAQRPGFVTEVHDGRLWVFKAGAKELARFRKDGELAKHVVRPGAGPLGATIKAPDAETILAYVAQRPGFVTEVHDGRLWVFKAGAKELERFRKDGELAKHVVRPGAGPLGTTLKAPDAETLDAYLATQP